MIGAVNKVSGSFNATSCHLKSINSETVILSYIVVAFNSVNNLADSLKPFEMYTITAVYIHILHCTHPLPLPSPNHLSLPLSHKVALRCSCLQELIEENGATLCCYCDIHVLAKSIHFRANIHLNYDVGRVDNHVKTQWAATSLSHF